MAKKGQACESCLRLMVLTIHLRAHLEALQVRPLSPPKKSFGLSPGHVKGHFKGFLHRGQESHIDRRPRCFCKSIAIHLPLLSRYFCTRMSSSWQKKFKVARLQSEFWPEISLSHEFSYETNFPNFPKFLGLY